MHRLADTHAAAQGARQQQMAREAQLSRRCTELAEQMSQLEAALQQQLQAAQQTAASRQHQIMVRGFRGLVQCIEHNQQQFEVETGCLHG